MTETKEKKQYVYKCIKRFEGVNYYLSVGEVNKVFAHTGKLYRLEDGEEIAEIPKNGEVLYKKEVPKEVSEVINLYA